MKTKEQKKQELASVKDKFGKSKISIFTSFSGKQGGLKVDDMRQLRKQLKEDNGEYFVAKKTLINKVLGKYTDILKLEGSPGMVFGYDDEISIAKDVYDFSKKNKALELWGAVFEDKFIDQPQLISLASLPGREVLLGQVAGMINYPVTGLVSVLQGNIRNLLLVLSNIKK